MSMMESLCPGVRMIVYRYIRDDHYSRVVKYFNQYVAIGWDSDRHEYTGTRGPLEANWRRLPFMLVQGQVFRGYIYNMWTRAIVPRGAGSPVMIPGNY